MRLLGRDLRALPGRLPSLLSVLPERIREELPSGQAGESAGPGDSISLPRPPAGQPTSTQCPKSENMLRGRLIGLLIWGFVVLIIGFATA